MLQIREYLQKNKKNVISLGVLLALLIAIPLGLFLLKNTQIFRPKADIEGMIALGDGDCVTSVNGVKVLKCKTVPLKLTSPFTASSSASPSSSASSSASPSPSPSASSAQTAFNGPHNIPGKIEAEDFDNGGEGVAYHDTDPNISTFPDKKPEWYLRTNENVDTFSIEGMKTSSFEDKDFRSPAIDRLKSGEWLEYTVNVVTAGNYTVEIRFVPLNNDNSSLHIEVDGQNKTGTVTANSGGKNLKWQTISKSGIALTTGQHVLRIMFDDTGSNSDKGGFINFVNFKLDSQASLLERIQKSLAIGSVLAKDDECNDKEDNDTDGKIDKEDPGCHSDGDVNNKKSYDKKRLESSSVSPTATPSASPKPDCNDKKDNDGDSRIDEDDPECHTDGNPDSNPSYDKKRFEARLASPSPSATASASPSLSPSPSASATASATIFYRLAETDAGLAAATFTAYSQTPTLTTFMLADQLPGAKQIWVEFKNNLTGETRKGHITFTMIDVNPRVTSADCTLDINKKDLKVTLTGANFGSARGKLKNKETDKDIVLDWKDNIVVGILENPSISGQDGKIFRFNLTRGDGIELNDQIFCRVDTSVIALGARVFCRDQGDFDVPNVKVTVKDQNNNKVDETVTIAKDGSISGLKTKLQDGKRYILSIKAPNSLRRNTIFTAGIGTTFVSQVDGQPFILPVGDIAPVILNDGKINTLDRSELARQWSVLGRGSGVSSTGDFNKDSRVNSIDWACMRYDFNKSDEDIPDVSVLNPTPVPTPVSSTITIPVSSASPAVSPSSPGQRAAYFLPAPEATGSYNLNSEFSVDIDIWSQNEAANLFSAQLSFDPTALEVVRIDRGTILTSWVDDTFDNSAGSISLIAGLPSPGLKTVEGNDPLMAEIIFKGIKAGNTTITMDADSAIYSNSDNVNIITTRISTPVVIMP